MGLHYIHLDTRVRAFMLEEYNLDLNSKGLFPSPRLNASGIEAYPALLKQSIQTESDDWLSGQLDRGHLKREEYSTSPKTKEPILKAVPSNAADVLAQGEFNRYYIRAICRVALEDGITEVEIFRAKGVDDPRSRSAALIGKRIFAKDLLDDLRKNTGDLPPAYGVPGGPNSGLSVKLP